MTRITTNKGIQELARNEKLSITSDFYENFEDYCYNKLQNMCNRAKENKRNTLMARDI